ncbi:MAG: hypothetical protein JOZ50_00270, partial [Candidatus Eremiobacteraeota bacterium]|nr:hypothetical protein [Candidatus Eremiobacteraeota bacterium]
MRFVTAAELVPADLDAQERQRLAARASHSVRLRWFERSIEVRFDQSDAAQIFRQRYQAFVADDEPVLRCYAIQA